MKAEANTNASGDFISLLRDQKQDERTEHSARMLEPYTEQEIEQLYKQEPLTGE